LLDYYTINTVNKYLYNFKVNLEKKMAKKGMIEREKKRQKLVEKYEKREKLLLDFSESQNFEEKILIHHKIEKLPRNSSKTRLRNRCWKTGRPRGFYRDFGLCRNMVREMGHQGLLPGLTKSSW
jgi:small subunit ribosomal protein S14